MGRTPLTLDVEIGSGGVTPLLRPKKEERGPPFEERILAEEKRDLEEHWRLLYVALTRAADRLVVAGVAPKPKKDGSEARPENCWHVAVERALASLGAERVDQGGWGPALVYGAAATDEGRKKPRRPIARPLTVPDWARTVAPPEARPPRPLAPSALVIDTESSPPPSDSMRAAAIRGTWIHRLLERLPPVEPQNRPSAAHGWLQHSAGLSDAAEREAIVQQVCRVISDPAIAPLFGPGSLAEAPLAATLPDGRVIAGTVDRLLVEESTVSVLDFKTGRVPSGASAIPASHRAQMTAYAQALGVIFPGRTIRSTLLYTAGPTLFELPS